MTSVRSRCALLVGAVALTVAVAAPATAAAAPSPWLQAGHDAAASNDNTVESTLTSGTIGKAVALRSLAPIGRDCYDGRSVGSPLLSESRVYAVNGTAVAAYQAASGALLWRTELPDFNEYTLAAVSHGLVIVGDNDCGTNDPIGEVRAFSSTDGAPVWSLPLPYGDGLVDVSVSGKYVVAQTAEVGGEVDVSVFRVQDGTPVWTLTGQFGDSGIQDASARVVDGQVYTTGLDDNGYPQLQARSLTTGAVRWTAPAATVERGDSDLAGAGHLYVQSGGAVFDVDPATGAARFRLSAATHSLAVGDGRVYAACANDASIVCAYNATTGARLWVRGSHSASLSAIAAGGLLYLSNGQVLNAATGHTARTLPGSPLAVGQGRVAVRRKSGALTLYGLPGH